MTGIGHGRGRRAGTAGLRTTLITTLLTALLAASAACGVGPSEVVDAGPAPAISGTPTLVTIYLLRDGKLRPARVAARSAHVNDVLDALFKASGRPANRLSTALTGLSPAQTQLVRYSPYEGSRNDPDSTLSLRVRLFVSGWKISRAAMAQITCTARLSPEVWAVEIAHVAPGRNGRLKAHTCREYWDLAPEDGQLPP
ncbi:hypothetical protein Mame01_63690 [Microbispora amethystogenes]|uniref:GerMN domain-containing protein n=1 Tax=Microbispora cellulosiformans TaxID=2614688 RepID=A0A5J5JWN1_9ACTN|nr:hypothetical protein [Microbispora cellulosiformans]KAA9375308.1 hypothetical protein F5972_28550 [Microbispora cellulosiformans]GLW26327.1 hypothetical protein Mame01_63690 [Microbispora amethystogenes]